MKIFTLFIILFSVISCSTDNQNEDDVNYLSSYSDNENGDTDNNDGDSDNNHQNQDSENDSEESVIVERTFIVSVQKQGYYGSHKYYIDNELTSELSLIRGLPYVFDLTSSSTNYHPFYISTSQGGGNYNDEYLNGVTNSRATSGKLIFKVPLNSPSSLYFNCGFHYGMGGHLIIQ